MNNLDEMIIVSVEGEDQITLADFIEINENALCDEYINDLRTLRIGESCFIETASVKRIA